MVALPEYQPTPLYAYYASIEPRSGDSTSFKNPTFPEGYELPPAFDGNESSWESVYAESYDFKFYTYYDVHLVQGTTTTTTTLSAFIDPNQNRPAGFSFVYTKNLWFNNGAVYEVYFTYTSKWIQTDTIVDNFYQRSQDYGVAYYAVKRGTSMEGTFNAIRLPKDYTPSMTPIEDEGILMFLYGFGEQVLSSAQTFYDIINISIFGTPLILVLFGSGLVGILIYTFAKWIVPL